MKHRHTNVIHVGDTPKYVWDTLARHIACPFDVFILFFCLDTSRTCQDTYFALNCSILTKYTMKLQKHFFIDYVSHWNDGVRESRTT